MAPGPLGDNDSDSDTHGALFPGRPGLRLGGKEAATPGPARPGHDPRARPFNPSPAAGLGPAPERLPLYDWLSPPSVVPLSPPPRLLKGSRRIFSRAA